MFGTTRNKKKLNHEISLKKAKLSAVADEIEELRDQLNALVDEECTLENELEELQTTLDNLKLEEETEGAEVYSMQAKLNPRPKSEKPLSAYTEN